MRGLQVAIGFMSLAVAERSAAAQRPTCEFDMATGVLTVRVYDVRARVTATPTDITLNGMVCGGATVTTTDRIDVFGRYSYADAVTLSGTFAPGRTPEASGVSEIEIDIEFFGSTVDDVRVVLGGGSDTLRVTPASIDFAADGDADLFVPTEVPVTIMTGGGADIVDATAASGFENGLTIHGGPGADLLIGPDGFAADSIGYVRLYGEGGRDEIRAQQRGCSILGGPGNDLLLGGSGMDTFLADAVIDGNDWIEGGGSLDTVSYAARTAGVTVNVGGGDNGETGVEDDFIADDIPIIIGGAGDDWLRGGPRYTWQLQGGPGNDVLHAGIDQQVRLWGEDGDDDLYGGGATDFLWGGPGDDLLVGDDGDDRLRGGTGNDVLEGGAGNDRLHGEDGSDELYGSTGRDSFNAGAGDDVIFNGDDVAEEVRCGDGIDDAEPTSNDTYSDCEL